MTTTDTAPSKPNAAGGPIGKAWRATRTVIRDPAGTASLIALLFGLVISTIPAPRNWNVALHSVGYALVGGATFSFIYQFWANDALKTLIASAVVRSHRRVIRSMKEQLAAFVEDTGTLLNRHLDDLVTMHRRHWPLDTFPEGSTPNTDFNQHLEADLRQSTRYDFRGQSGKHLASRLIQNHYRKLKNLRVIIEDATMAQVMNARIDEKRFAEPGRLDRVADAELRRVILNDMLDCLIGLHSVRSRFDRLDVAYASRPTDVRLEIVDGVVYISPFVRNRSQGNRYPEVFRYDPSSVPAEVSSLEFDREFGMLSATSIQLARMTQADLWYHVVSKGWQLTQGEFDERYWSGEQSLRTLGRILRASGESNDGEVVA